VTAVSNVTGEIIDLERIRGMLARKFPSERRPFFIVDASQLLPHSGIDVQALDIDFLVFTGHKVMADTGLGIVYGKKSLLQKLTPSFG
jgi:selenocysteine lyase/cysteine desulfurase